VLYHALRRTYQRLGFKVLDLPKASVQERVAFVRAVVGT
jgi:predicted ATPase